jgi:dienelactone hydrolase
VLDVSYIVTTWLPSQNADSTSPLFGKVNVAAIGLAGHSRGGYVSLLAAEQGVLGKLKGLFGLDPVDTTPSATTAIATIGVPLAFIGETTDSTGTSACAPAADNYQVFYADAASPITAITAVGADHTMFEDAASCTLCTLCTAGTASQPAVLAYSVRYLTAFFARVLEGDTSVGETFDGAGAQSDIASGAIAVESK